MYPLNVSDTIHMHEPYPSKVPQDLACRSQPGTATYSQAESWKESERCMMYIFLPVLQRLSLVDAGTATGWLYCAGR